MVHSLHCHCDRKLNSPSKEQDAMTLEDVAERAAQQPTDENAIRPFHVNVPDAELDRIAQARQRDQVA
jgi:hypothetical protein